MLAAPCRTEWRTERPSTCRAQSSKIPARSGVDHSGVDLASAAGLPALPLYPIRDEKGCVPHLASAAHSPHAVPLRTSEFPAQRPGSEDAPGLTDPGRPDRPRLLVVRFRVVRLSRVRVAGKVDRRMPRGTLRRRVAPGGPRLLRLGVLFRVHYALLSSLVLRQPTRYPNAFGSFPPCPQRADRDTRSHMPACRANRSVGLWRSLPVAHNSEPAG